LFVSAFFDLYKHKNLMDFSFVERFSVPFREPERRSMLTTSIQAQGFPANK